MWKSSSIKVIKTPKIDNDVNYFMKKDHVNLNMEKVKYFLEHNAKLNPNNNLQHFDLNNILKYFAANYGVDTMSTSKKRKFKIKLDAFGVDKFSQRNNMSNDFCIEITYILI
jgi:hypothetical protein